MTLTETRKLSKHICRLLKVSEINFPIGRTPKGNLGLVFNANNDDFEMMLDSVPLSTKNSLEDENNIELKAMLEKYLFDTEMHVHTHQIEYTSSKIIPSEGQELKEVAPKLNEIIEKIAKTNGNPKTKKSS